MDLSNDRGSFELAVLMKILDKLTYLDKYPELDMSMSGSNIGARRNKKHQEPFVHDTWHNKF